MCSTKTRSRETGEHHTFLKGTRKWFDTVGKETASHIFWQCDTNSLDNVQILLLFIDSAKTNLGGSLTPGYGGATPAQSCLILWLRRANRGLTFDTQSVASFSSLSRNSQPWQFCSSSGVKEKVKRELKKLPCKFWLEVKLKANVISSRGILSLSSAAFFSSSFFLIKSHCHCLASRHTQPGHHLSLFSFWIPSNERRLSSLAVWFGVSTNTQLLRSIDAVHIHPFLYHTTVLVRLCV